MSNIPDSLRYAKSHEWLRIEGDIATIGITDHAQAELTDVVFVELPETGRVLAVGDNCAVVESVKTASDLYAPLTGTVLEINAALADIPELANDSPFDEGWFFKLQIDGEPDTAHLLDAAGYAAEIGEA
ncbi:MAG: glycine cleavage system protein GcvH [Verrucomicrobiota bacterium]|nr:glycine cleavage system protein GcvH [Verrucomicrobiota bacterium]